MVFPFRWTMVLWGVLLVQPAPAQVPDPVHPITLDAVLQAVAGHPMLEAQRLAAEAQQVESHRFGALPDPQVTAQYMPRALLTGRGLQRSRWQVEQTLPYPGKRGLQQRIAALSAAQAARSAEAYALDLAHTARTTYAQLERIQAHLKHLTGFQAQMALFAEMAAVRYEGGQGRQADVLQAQLEKNRLAQQQLRLQRERGTACATLARLMDDPRVRTCAPAALRDHHTAPLPLSLPVDTTGRQRPEVQRLDLAAEQAAQELALAERQFRPDFKVSVAYLDVAATDVLPTADGRDAWMVGVGVSVPLWRGRLRASREAAQIRRREVAQQQAALALSIQAEVADFKQQMAQERRILTLLNQTLAPQAEGLAESAGSAYATGQAGFSDLLAAERARFQIHMDTADAHYRYHLAEAGLLRALGHTQAHHEKH